MQFIKQRLLYLFEVIMACGCNKRNGIYRSTPVARNSVTKTPAQALRQQAVPPPSAQTANTIVKSAEQRRTHALRRDAIRKALNK